MKEKVKKILTTTLLSAATISAVGCGVNGNKLAKNIDKSMADFVSSINNLDYVETGKPANDKVGKIVETGSSLYGTGTHRISAEGNQIKFLNNNVSETEIENTITKPTERKDDFKLFVLSETPFISLTSNDNNANLSFNIKFSTNKIEETSTEIDEKINTLILKRSILMIYVNEIYNGNVTLSEENKTAINAYVNVIKENTSFLNGNRGMVKNQLKLATDLVEDGKNENLVNYYIIKSGEALENRASKLDSTISAIDSITKIIEDNLSSTSTYYNTKLSDTYQNIISNINSNSNTQINANSSNKEIADSISNSLNFLGGNKTQSSNEQNNVTPTPTIDTKDIKTPTNNTNNNGLTTYPMVDRNSQNNTNLGLQNSRQNGFQNNRQNPALNQNNNNQTIQRGPQIRNNNPNDNIMTLEENYKDNTRKEIQPRVNSTTGRMQNRNHNINARRNNNQFQSTNQNLTNNQNNANNSNIAPNFTQNAENLQNLNNNSTFDQNRMNNVTTSNQFRRLNSNMNKLDNEDSKTMRAERTPERVTKEQYTSASANEDLKVTRVPYKSTNAIKR